MLGAIILASLSVGVALAQSEETTVPFCGSLSESQCSALEATAEIMAGLTSGTSENQFKIYATGALLGDQELSLVLTSDNSFVIDAKTLERLNALSAMPPEELAADPAALTEAAMLPLSIDRDQTISLAFSPEMVAHFADTLQVTLPNPLAFHLRVVNGVIYIRLADFGFLGTLPDWTPEWLGIETRAILSATVTSGVANSTIDAASVQSALVPPGAALEGSIVYHVPAEQLAAYDDFMNLTALGVIQQNDEPAQLYYLTWDLARYLGGPLFAARMGQPFPSPQSRMWGSLGTLLLEGLTTDMKQTVGVANSYVHSVDTEAAWAIGLPGGQLMADRPVLGFSMTMQNSDLNTLRRILPPRGAFVPPINLLFALMGLFQN